MVQGCRHLCVHQPRSCWGSPRGPTSDRQVMVTLNKSLILPANMGLFGKSREMQFGTNKLWQSHGQAQQRRGEGRGEARSWEKSQTARALGADGFSLAEVQGGGSHPCRRCPAHVFLRTPQLTFLS